MLTARPADALSAAVPELVTRLNAVLQQTMERADPDFKGTGVIVTSAPEQLPLYAMRPDAALPEYTDITAFLAAISVADHELHDGFHILSPDLHPLAVAQYFSPPILPDIHVDRSRPFGGRYLAALFGSGLDGVMATGIATPGFGVATFVGGREVTRF